MTHHHDEEDLRERFRALAARADDMAPAFSRARIAEHRGALRSRRLLLAWFAVAGVATAATAATVMIVARPTTPEARMYDFGSTTWIAPSDFLLVPPGAALLNTAPVFVTVYDSLPAAPPSSRGDTLKGDDQ